MGGSLSAAQVLLRLIRYQNLSDYARILTEWSSNYYLLESLLVDGLDVN